MIRQSKEAIYAYFDAIPAIGKYGLIKYFILSGIIGVAVAIGLFFSARGMGTYFTDLVDSFYKFSFGKAYFATAMSWISTAGFLIVFSFIFRYVMLIIQAPLMSMISAEIEEKYTGVVPEKFSFSKAIGDLVRGLRIALRNISRELFFTFLLMLIGLFPLFSIFSVIGIFMVQAYFAGFGNIDYYLERRMNVRESVGFVKDNKGMAMGNGAVYLALLLIPVIGVMFGPALGTISATIDALDYDIDRLA
jgi:CysZ protein